MKDWETHFRYTSSNPYIKSKIDLNLLTDKGVYPYDYMNSWDKFDETKLPKKEYFTVNYTKKTKLTKTTPEQILYGNILALKTLVNDSSTAQGGGGSFENRKPIGELGCCESGMAERSH